MLRTYLGSVLILILLVTGQSAAVARATPGPAGRMVLCTGAGLVTVFVDEDGDPVGAPHVCPDAALGFLVALDLPDLPLIVQRVARERPAAVPGIVVLTSPAPLFHARAPPLTV